LAEGDFTEPESVFSMVTHYQKRISGLLMDWIDIDMQVHLAEASQYRMRLDLM